MSMRRHKEIEAQRYEVFLDQAVNTMAVIGFTGLVIIAFMTLVDVSFRYFGISRIPGLNDLEEVGFAIVIASCFPAGLKAGNAVTVKILGSLLGNRAKKFLDLFGAIFVLGFFCLVSWQFISFTIDYAIAGSTSFLYNAMLCCSSVFYDLANYDL
jgi:TRAP-type C4-dicarboxylate transport system permease small subunit